MNQSLIKWAKRTLLVLLLGALFGCSTNTYDHIGRQTVATPYDTRRYQRVEDYLRQQGLLDPADSLPADSHQAAPTLGPDSKQ